MFYFKIKHTKICLLSRGIMTISQNLYNYLVFKEPQQRQLFYFNQFPPSTLFLKNKKKVDQGLVEATGIEPATF